MLFKIDENLHEEVNELLRDNGHDSVSVYDQQMRGRSDEEIAAVCKREGRVIVTQDLDFSNIVAYPPKIIRASSSFTFMTRLGLPSSRSDLHSGLRSLAFCLQFQKNLKIHPEESFRP